MHVGFATLDAEASVRDVARQMRDGDVGVAPVVSNGRLIGMITDRAIACRAVAGQTDLRRMKASEVMNANVIARAPDDDVKDAMLVMSREKVRRLPVLDRDERLVGMLSLGDISHRVDDAESGHVLRAVSAHHA